MGLFGKKSSASVVGGGFYSGYKAKVAESIGPTNGRVERTLRENVAVVELTHGAGSTYVSAAIANYLYNRGMGETMLVHDIKDEYLEEILMAQVVRDNFPINMAEIYSACDCLIQDFGVYKELDSNKKMALSMASTKIVVCNADDDYMRLLADFTRERTDADRFYYLFNRVPREWERKVGRVMDEYEAYCLPMFFARTPGTDMTQIFRRIFRR